VALYLPIIFGVIFCIISLCITSFSSCHQNRCYLTGLLLLCNIFSLILWALFIEALYTVNKLIHNGLTSQVLFLVFAFISLALSTIFVLLLSVGKKWLQPTPKILLYLWKTQMMASVCFLGGAINQAGTKLWREEAVEDDHLLFQIGDHFGFEHHEYTKFEIQLGAGITYLIVQYISEVIMILIFQLEPKVQVPNEEPNEEPNEKDLKAPNKNIN